MKEVLVMAIVISLPIYANEIIDDIGAEIPDHSQVTHSERVIREHADSRVVLWNNGPWYNSAGTGVWGADESILQDWGTVFGYGFQLSNGNYLADDFTVPVGQEWILDRVTIAGYQIGSGLTPTIDGMYIAVYDDNPNTGMMIAGDPYTNVFTSAQWSGIYRVREGESGINADRPIMAIVSYVPYPIILDSGTYWISFQTDGASTLSGPWHPPVVIWDVPETGNALQSSDGGFIWQPIVNGVYAQGILFYLEAFYGLQTDTWGSIKTMF